MVRALQETEIKSSFIKYPGSIALAFTIGLLVVFFWAGAFHYEVNDDVGITALVKGLFGFKASPNGIFISLLFYSHSIVPGGFEVTSNTTRFTSRTSLVIRVEIFSNVSYGTRDQSAVIASSLDTGRNTIG